MNRPGGAVSECGRWVCYVDDISERVRCVLAPGHAGPHSDDGAPFHGGVTDPAATSGGPSLADNLRRSLEQHAQSRYRPSIIASCPRCGSDLDDEGFSYWCPGCQETISAREACMFDEGLPDE